MRKLASILFFFFLCTGWTPVDPTHAFLHLSGANPYDFGQVEIGAVKIHSMMLGNAGGIDAVKVDGGGLDLPFRFTANKPFPGGGGDCADTLISGKDCQVRIAFAPTVEGEFSGNLAITYFDGEVQKQFELPVHGIGVPAGTLRGTTPGNELVLSGGPEVNFGDVIVGNSVTTSYKLINMGSAPVYFYEFFLDYTKNQINFTGTGDFPGVGGTCTGDHIDAGKSCTLSMTFKPAAVAAVKSNFKINYYYNNKLQKLTTVFKGNGVTQPQPAVLSFNGAEPFDFGNVVLSTASDRALILMNSGGTAATNIADYMNLAAPFSYKGGAYPGTGGTCSDTLGPKLGCAIVLTFNPADVGVFSDAVMLKYFDGVATQNISHSLQGTGILQPALITISDTDPFDFGNVLVNDVYVHVFTVHNAGVAKATALTGGDLPLPFKYAAGAFPGKGGTCTAELEGGASCTVRVSFKPTTVGPYDATLTVNYNDSQAAQSTSRLLTGTGK